MLRTGLPYKESDIATAYEEGAIIDLSKVNFPTCKTLQENMHAMFVYLRNTGYNVQFDFIEMTYEQKVALLKEYLDTKIDYNIPELNTTWLSILYACLGIRINGMVSILNDLELITMQSAEFEYIKKIWQFLLSCPLFLIKRLDVQYESTAEKTEEVPNLVNMYYILADKHADDLINRGAGDIPPLDYVNVFTVENTRLFEALQHCSFATFVYGIAASKDDEFKEFVASLSHELTNSDKSANIKL